MFVIPLPDALLSHVITALQSNSADVTDVFFKLISLPVVREGFTFVMLGFQIEVARQCSGICAGGLPCTILREQERRGGVRQDHLEEGLGTFLGEASFHTLREQLPRARVKDS